MKKLCRADRVHRFIFAFRSSMISVITITSLRGLIACTADTMSDAKIEIHENSLEIVDLRDESDSALWPGKAAKSSQHMGMITFSSNFNLRDLSERNESEFSNYMYLCNNSDQNSSGEMRNDVYIYDPIGRVSPYRDDNSHYDKYKETNKFLYHIYFYLNSPRINSIFSNKNPSSMYDLENKPEDICVSVWGDDLFGRAHGSNVITIPAGQIRETLRQSVAPSLPPKP